MRLVKARIKSIQDTDPRFLCCPKRIEWHKERIKEGLVKLDMDSIRTLDSSIHCGFCKKEMGSAGLRKVMVHESAQEQCRSGLTFLDYFDLDEGAECPPSA